MEKDVAALVVVGAPILIVVGAPTLLVDVEDTAELVCCGLASVVVDCAVMVREVDVGPGKSADGVVS